MSEPKYREWILETIDSLRSRKARPDLERICRMVRRRHGSDPDRTRTELEKLIQQQTVLKVSYKGSISYRNAAKVQRKSRKKTELAPACSAGSEESRERTHHHILNNGDSAHSFTDQEDDSEPSLDQRLQTPTNTTENTTRESCDPRSGSVCLSCGATTGCVGSGCQRENASALKDPGLGQHLKAGCPSPSHDHIVNATDCDNDTITPPDAHRKEPGSCGAAGGSGEAEDAKKETCPVRAAAADEATSIETQKPPVALKPAQVGQSDLGDRLVSSVRSLSERNVRAYSGATRGQIKPLGLREILGHLSGQEWLSEEKLTRGRVKGVLEREIARGRLRRTRCGNITLPLRGVMVLENMTTDRHLNRVAQGRNIVGKEKDVEEGCGEKEEEEEEEEDQDDLQSAEKEEEVITKPGLEDDADIESPPENPQHLQQYCGVSVQDSLPRTRSLPAWDGLPSHTSIQPGDSIATTDTLQRDAHDLSPPPPIPCLDQVEMQFRASPIINNVVCRGEVGMRQGVSEEQGMNGGFDDGLPMKSEGLGMSPVDWTVSDVASYFAAVGFPEQAVAFKAQEIDGKSLLLMQRNDVLTGLSIRLGPAVKIYERHVKALQKTHFEDDDC
ncbi:atherin isoform X1 [Gadus morhua]|uniref:atherin isoform X1 n=1 Tax=Gadus morhua TaxID=8049 RepID=UPI0011B714DF|nr:atherin-like isoform X1 [Gadus morhua]